MTMTDIEKTLKSLQAQIDELIRQSIDSWKEEAERREAIQKAVSELDWWIDPADFPTLRVYGLADIADAICHNTDEDGNYDD